MARPRLGFEPKERLSIGGMRFFKLAPTLLFTAFGLSAIYGSQWGSAVDQADHLSLILIGSGLLILAAVYYWYVAGLADSVMDYGDHLEVTRGNVSQTIRLAEIVAIGREAVGNRHNRDWHITMFLDKPGPFGQQIVFCRRVLSSGYSSTPDPRIADLKARIDRASPTANDRQS